MKWKFRRPDDEINNKFGRYPSCDFINNAIRYIKKGNTDAAIVELYYAVTKADGYFYDDVKDIVQEKYDSFWEINRRNKS